MRILFASDGVFPNSVGGMARHSRGLVSAMASAGADITLVHPGPERAFPGGSIQEVLVAAPKASFKGHYIWETYELSRRIARAVGGQYAIFDVAYAQGTALWSTLRAKPFPVTVNPHGLEMFQPIGRREVARAMPFRWIMRRQTRRADSVISLGGRLTEILRSRLHVPPHRIVVIPNAVDLADVDARIDPTLARPRSFVYVGRLFSNKGATELIDAFNLIEEDATLTVIGDGPLKEQLRRSALHRGITFLGSVDDAALFRALSEADALILPTLGEGMPTVILEAMAAGKPIIASDVGAVSELVGPDNGLLVRPGDIPGLRVAIQRFIGLPDARRRELGRCSRLKVEGRFTWDRVARATLDHLSDLAGSR